MTNKQFDKKMSQLAHDEAFVANERIIAILSQSIHTGLKSDQRVIKEEPIVKRKVSFALVCVLTLILLAGVALAIVSFQDAARQIALTEQQDGYYAAWPAEKKIALVKAIVEHGYAEETQAVERLLAGSLSAEDAGRTANEVLVAFTGKEVSEISFMEIMIAAWGPFEQWSVEEQTWYSQLMVEMGLQGTDHTLYVQPVGVVDEAKAIAIARREIAEAYGVAESMLDAYTLTTSFQVPEFAEQSDNQPYWMVEYWAPETMTLASRLFPTSFWVFVHPETGALLEPATILRDSFQEQMDNAFEIDLTMQVADSFAQSHTSVESMMDFRKKWEPKLDMLIKAGQVPENESYHPRHVQKIAKLIPKIGLPQAGDIGENEALESAKQCITAIPGWPEEQRDYLALALAAYLTSESGDAPAYHFVFSLPRITSSMSADSEKEFFKRRDAYNTAFGGEELAPKHVYLRIDARTGKQVGEPKVLYSWPVYYEDFLVE